MKYWPQWTRRVVIEGTGRDPLGLSRVSDALTDFLLPCIITTTDRARYYSFYTWAVADIQSQCKSAASHVSFEEEFQRREAVFALASHLGHKTNFPIVGVRQVNSILAQAAAGDPINTTFQVLPSNTMGGYGQYYAGCLSKLGLVDVSENGDRVVTSEHGRAIAMAFATATAKAPYLAERWRTKPRVPLDVIQKSSEAFSLDGLRTSAASHERSLLLHLFFSLGEAPSATAPLNRQATLGQFLHVLKAYEEAGLSVEKPHVDRAVVFWPHYYGNLYAETGRLRSYTPLPAFSAIHAFWRQFCAHQFFAFAMEEFLAAVLEVLSPHAEGLDETALISELVDFNFLEDLRVSLDTKCARPDALLSAVGATGVPNVSTSHAAARRFGASHPLSEWAICREHEAGPNTRLGRCVFLLALLYSKWRGRDDDRALTCVSLDAKNELWMGTSFFWLDSWLQEKLDWRTAVARLLHWMVPRLDQVKFQKHKLDASWLEMANGRYIKEQDILPAFRGSRHGNAAMILHDLALLDHNAEKDTWQLTTKGKQILQQVILARA